MAGRRVVSGDTSLTGLDHGGRAISLSGTGQENFPAGMVRVTWVTSLHSGAAVVASGFRPDTTLDLPRSRPPSVAPHGAGPPNLHRPAVPDWAPEVLGLLGQGLTDHTVARRLGVSERTIGRRVTHLQALLGSSSRFQLGVEAARRGLVEG